MELLEDIRVSLLCAKCKERLKKDLEPENSVLPGKTFHFLHGSILKIL